MSDQKKMRLFISGRIVSRRIVAHQQPASNFQGLFRALHSESLNKTEPATGSKSASTLGQRIPFVPPLANAAVHRDDVLISPSFCKLSAAIAERNPASAVKHDLCIDIRDAAVDVAFDHAICSDEYAPGRWSLANSHSLRERRPVETSSHLSIFFFTSSTLVSAERARPGVARYFQEPRSMLGNHKISLF